MLLRPKLGATPTRPTWSHVRAGSISDGEIVLRLAIVVVLCGAIGLERQARDQIAGLRTHVIVGLGAALFTLVSAYGFSEFEPIADRSDADRGPGGVRDRVPGRRCDPASRSHRPRRHHGRGTVDLGGDRDGHRRGVLRRGRWPRPRSRWWRWSRCGDSSRWSGDASPARRSASSSISCRAPRSARCSASCGGGTCGSRGWRARSSTTAPSACRLDVRGPASLDVDDILSGSGAQRRGCADRPGRAALARSWTATRTAPRQAHADGRSRSQLVDEVGHGVDDPRGR